MVKLYSTKDSRQKEQLQMLFSQNNIPYKLKTKSSSPLHVMDSAVLGSMKQPPELIHTFLVPEKDADRARMLLQHIEDKL